VWGDRVKLSELLRGVTILDAPCGQDPEITAVCCDSRQVQPGALFVAMRGAKDDGHRYIGRALESGAAAVVCRARPEGEGPFWVIDDPRLAMARIAGNWFGRPGDHLTLVAVTGTNGKTTTTSLIREMLQRTLHTRVGLIGTNRNLVGEREVPAQRTTPDSWQLHRLLRQMVDEGCTHAVMEVSSHALTQHRTAGLLFDVAVFTNLTQDHLDYHRTMQAYRAAKGMLFRQCRQAVVNLDDEAGRWYRGRVTCPVYTYSECRDCADLTARGIRLFPGHVEFEAVTREEIARIHLPIPGGFTIYNALAALAAGRCLGLELSAMAAALRCVQGVKGRIEVVSVPRAYTVIIDYAHTPNALENILLTARSFTAGRLICLFGCGGERDTGKRPVMGALAQELADLVVVTSDNPRGEDPMQILSHILSGMDVSRGKIHVEPDRAAAIGWALDQGRAGDVIVLAGKGHETYQEIGGVRIPFDERDVVARWFARQGRQEKTGNEPLAVV